MRWFDETLIAIVVFGAQRPFVFRPRVALVEVPSGSWGRQR
jgi:hypothetical protein